MSLTRTLSRSLSRGPAGTLAGSSASSGPAPIRNLLRYSEQINNPAWLKTASGTGAVPTVTANYGTAPDSALTADRVQLNGGAAGISQVTQAVAAVASGVASTYSIYLMSLSGTVSVTLFSQSTTANASVTGAWQRFSLPVASGTGAASDVRIALRDVWGTTGTADLLVWGGQFELGALSGYQMRE